MAEVDLDAVGAAGAAATLAPPGRRGVHANGPSVAAWAPGVNGITWTVTLGWVVVAWTWSRRSCKIDPLSSQSVSCWP